ncbi:MAG: hypothetical protein H0T58_07800 [Gemmatimonadales bacterium]|nr:hypothetical protein [Gemmatimonadales bacterium]
MAGEGAQRFRQRRRGVAAGLPAFDLTADLLEIEPGDPEEREGCGKCSSDSAGSPVKG